MNEQSPVTEIKGIGNKTASYFQKAGVTTIGDLWEYYPRDYITYEKAIPIVSIQDEKLVTIKGTITSISKIAGNRNLKLFSAMVSDGTGKIKLTWFNIPYMREQLKMDTVYIFRGRTVYKNNRFLMEQPALFSEEEYNAITGRLIPVYPLVKGMSNKTVTKAVTAALEVLSEEKEFLPEPLRKELALTTINDAYKSIHRPESMEDCLNARNRLVFNEFFFFLLQLKLLKTTDSKEESSFIFLKNELTDQILKALPYQLTKAQLKVLKDINDDFDKNKIMSRLIQGDVGCGKTIVAILALVRASENGYQGALMVPTDVLARQHYESVTGLLDENRLNIPVILLTGTMSAKEKHLAYEQIEDGSVKIIIGTHALFQEKVRYQNLALVITDEQHRFGVKQREALADKGKKPHVLVMSATPIPRTLAIILYGDLDISMIDEMPKNRIPIKNCVVNKDYRTKAYTFMQKEIENGRQVYVICPMVEPNEDSDLEDVVTYAEALKTVFPPFIKIAFLHGKMKPLEKNLIMEQFLKKEIHILVSTTVIEVGVNVPNATVMLIENAERFGLAELHQLRGRVGRGGHQSYCIFMHSYKDDKSAKKLQIVNKSNDGFHIANEDLKLRGPGELFGIRQSGALFFKLADIYRDAAILAKANEAVNAVENQELIIKNYNFTYNYNL